jgi:hypothetical protein
LGKHLIDTQVHNNAQISSSEQNFVSSKELIKLDDQLRSQNNSNLINTQTNSNSDTFNQQNGTLSENLINTHNTEFF